MSVPDPREDVPTPSLASADAEARLSLGGVVVGRRRVDAASRHGPAAPDRDPRILPPRERPLVRLAMELAEGSQRQAAAMLGIHRNTLRKRLEALGLDGEHRGKSGHEA